MVAVTLDMSEEELFFQFGMDNWSAYVDQVRPLHLIPFSPPRAPCPSLIHKRICHRAELSCHQTIAYMSQDDVGGCVLCCA